eukprot:763600-Hanusia_phi.AAC.1
MHGKENRVIPGNFRLSCSSDRLLTWRAGNAVAVSPGKPFRGLQTFGNSFLQKFQCAETNAEILESMTLIDTPGVLSGEKQRIGRNYDMAEVNPFCKPRPPVIVLTAAAAAGLPMLDISDELKIVIESLSGNDDKVTSRAVCFLPPPTHTSLFLPRCLLRLLHPFFVPSSSLPYPRYT